MQLLSFTTPHVTAHSWRRALLLGVLVFAACGSDGDDTTASGAESESETTTTTAPPVDEAVDLDLATEALLRAEDLPEGDWTDQPPETVFPMSAELAASVPSCVDFVDVVFEGGSEHGEAISGAIGRGTDLVWTYAVVFPTEDAATAMLESVSDPAFDECWVDFNEAAALVMPFGITSASYTKAEPPDLTISADDVNVEHMAGEIVVGGTTLEDSCVCAFVRSGRGVVAVHSTEAAMDVEERSAVAQAAADKMAATLGE